MNWKFIFGIALTVIGAMMVNTVVLVIPGAFVMGFGLALLGAVYNSHG